MMIKTIVRTPKKTEALRFGFFILLSVCVLNCKPKQPTAKEIVERSVEAHGGLETWNAIQRLSFDKATTLFNADGTIEKETKQAQTFHFKPQLKGNVRDLTLPGIHSYSYDNDTFTRTANDSIWTVTDESEIAALRSSFFAAHYVICQPFELLSDQASLSYGGTMDFNGRTCHIVEVTYKGDTDDADKWSYIFDAETFELLANKVELTDHTSWVENLSFDNETGLKFNAHRKSYRLNEAGEKTYLRAEYFYENFKVMH